MPNFDRKPALVAARQHGMAGVLPVDVEMGNVEALAAQYPQVAADLKSYPQPAQK